MHRQLGRYKNSILRKNFKFQFLIIFIYLILDNTLAVASFSGANNGHSSVNLVIGAVIGGFLLGILLVVLGLLYALHRQGGQLDLGRFGSIGGSKPRIPSSPHYLSAKQQNHYVSMGSLDWKKSSSVIDNCSNNGTIGRVNKPPPLKITVNSGTSTDYPTATIKRNSGGHNQMRTNIEADDMF